MDMFGQAVRISFAEVVDLHSRRACSEYLRVLFVPSVRSKLSSIPMPTVILLKVYQGRGDQ